MLLRGAMSLSRRVSLSPAAINPEGEAGEIHTKMHASVSPLISVLLPFYNSEHTLAEAVNSIIRQTWPEWELLLVDDGSDDASPDIAAEFAAKDSRIRLFSCTRNMGIVEALQQGAAHARGEFLARMDADDWAHPERLTTQQALMQEDPELGLCGAQVTVFGGAVGSGRRRYEQWLNTLLTHESIVRELFVECPVAHPAFFLRRTAFEQVGGYRDCGEPEDYDLVMRLWLGGYRLANAPQRLLHWRDESGRLSRSDPRYSETAFRRLKQRFLAQTYLARGRRFFQLGAGEVGKRWLRDWPNGMRPEAVVDINPRKIGRWIHGFPVIAPETLPPPADCFIVAAVGAPDARETIRAWFSERGYSEIESYVFLA